MNKDCRIILASGSPRRRELLTQVGIEFTVDVSDAKEIIREDTPGEIVKQLSHDKALAVKTRHGDDELIIAADTVVTLDGEILGKPHDEKEAFDMLRKLSGRNHSVFTGVTLMMGDKEMSFAEETKVNVYELSDEDIDEYIATGDCMDKAGAYGIQGFFAKHVSGIVGDYNNVVGLPVARLVHEMKNF